MKDKKRIKYDVAIYFPTGNLYISFECDEYESRHGYTKFYNYVGDPIPMFEETKTPYYYQRELMYSFSNAWLIKIEEQ